MAAPVYSASMGAFRDRVRLSPGGPDAPSGDVVVTVAASGVRDAEGRPVAAPAAGDPGEARKLVGELRSERVGLARRYLELRGDLGGLLIEMARRDHFNLNLLRLKAAEAVQVERRAQDIDGVLAVHAAPGRQTLPPGTVAVTAARCPTCTGAIPADANFCAYCGTPTR